MNEQLKWDDKGLLALGGGIGETAAVWGGDGHSLLQFLQEEAGEAEEAGRTDTRGHPSGSRRGSRRLEEGLRGGPA